MTDTAHELTTYSSFLVRWLISFTTYEIQHVNCIQRVLHLRHFKQCKSSVHIVVLTAGKVLNVLFNMELSIHQVWLLGMKIHTISVTGVLKLPRKAWFQAITSYRCDMWVYRNDVCPALTQRKVWNQVITSYGCNIWGCEYAVYVELTQR